MFGLFNENNFLHVALMKVWDLVLANLLFILCSIPLITIGPALTALYHCTLRIVKGNNPGTFKTFFRAFKQNFKQSFIVWIVVLLIGGILGSNLNFLRAQTGQSILFYMTLILCVFLFAFVLYIFPVIATFEGTLKMHLRNTLIFSVTKFFKTIIMVVLWGFCFFITYIDNQLQPLYVFCWFFFGFSTLAYICSFMLYKMFKPYLPVEEEPDESKYYEEHSAYLS